MADNPYEPPESGNSQPEGDSSKEAAHIIWVGNTVNFLWAIVSIFMAATMKGLVLRDPFFVIVAAVAILNLVIAWISPRSALRHLALGIAYILYTGRWAEITVHSLLGPTSMGLVIQQLGLTLIFIVGAFRIFFGRLENAYFSQKNCK